MPNFIRLNLVFFKLILILLCQKSFADEIHEYAAVGIGLMQVNVTTYVSEAVFKRDFVKAYGVNKGKLNIISNHSLKKIISELKHVIVSPGGETAGVLYQLSKLSTKTALITHISSDEYSEFLQKQYKLVGVDTFTGLKTPNLSTSIILNIITPDGTKTKLLGRGSNSEISQRNLRYDVIKDGDFFVFDTTIWDGKGTKAKAIKRGLTNAQRLSKKIVFLLTDVYFLSIHKKDFLSIVENSNIVIGNQFEYEELFDSRSVEELHKTLSKYIDTMFVMSTKDVNAIVFYNDKLIKCSGKKFNKEKIDTTGAGVSFAAGFLFKIYTGHTMYEACSFGHANVEKILKQPGNTIHFEE